MGLQVEGGDSGGGSMAEINVIPLVDVMLVLLIIFMITAPLLSTGVDLDLPRVEAPPMTTPTEDQVVLSVDADLRYFINDNRFTLEELPERLHAMAEAQEGEPVFIMADGDVPYKNVAELLGLAKNAGIPRVGMVFEPGVDVE